MPVIRLCKTCGESFTDISSGTGKKWCSNKCRLNFKKTIDSNGCWLWTGGRDKDGYGNTYINNKQTRVHRLSYEEYHGFIKPGYVIMHQCDNPSCFNPDHLKQGTPKDNTQDMISKGRSGFGKNAKCGEEASSAKLSKEQVLQAFNSTESSKILAERFGVYPQAIDRIRSGVSWSSVTGLPKRSK